jgi:hypothetical protein
LIGHLNGLSDDAREEGVLRLLFQVVGALEVEEGNHSGAWKWKKTEELKFSE